MSEKRRQMVRAMRFLRSRSFLLLGIGLSLVLATGIEWQQREWAKSASFSADMPVSSPAFDDVNEAQTDLDLFYPAWQKALPWASAENEARPYGLEESEIDSLMADPDDRLSQDFDVTPVLIDRVRFWVGIYSRYNSKMRVVHDREKLGIVYGFIDLRPIFRSYGATAQAEMKAEAAEKRVLRSLKDKILASSSNNLKPFSSPEEFSAFKSFLSRHGVLNPSEAQRLAQSLRTQTGQSDIFLTAIHRSRHLLPHIESVFKRQGLPPELGRIPFVESSFNPHAHSKVGAIGIWQLMPATARELLRTDEVSTWADPLKQTVSAARLLKSYRSVLPDWGSTVTSYNAGIGRVRRLQQTYRVKTVEELISLNVPDGLGFAGKNFYAEVLAANIVEAYKEAIFGYWLEPSDFALVFKGLTPFPKDSCDM